MRDVRPPAMRPGLSGLYCGECKGEMLIEKRTQTPDPMALGENAWMCAACCIRYTVRDVPVAYELAWRNADISGGMFGS